MPGPRKGRRTLEADDKVSVFTISDSIHHYQNLIDGDTHLREDLSGELASVRKEAAVLRSCCHLTDSSQTSDCSAYADADTIATAMVSVTSFSITNQSCNLTSSQATIVQLRGELLRHIRFSEYLENETKDLREAIIREALEKVNAR
ncbi:unnamed protein product [Trichobilharzia szidati]|nr:unnamed protein product [Trichobilharzia szidati]